MIASRLLKAMSDKGFNQKQLAEAAGLTRAAVCRYLQGSRTAREDALIAISKTLDVSIDWLLGAEKAEPKRGRWIEERSGKVLDLVKYHCSECGRWQTWSNFPYCPNCGARMDGGENG